MLDGLQAAPPARGKPADGQGEVREDASQPRRSGAADGAEPAPSGSLAGVWASADSIWSEDMRGIMAILAVTLLGGVALGLRRRSRTGV